MISDISDFPHGHRLSADVVVVGTGIAGSEVALYLARRGVDVLLLESGRETFDPEIQNLNDVDFLGKRHRKMDPDAGYHPYLPPELRGVSRMRQFGGTSNVWTGKWKYLQRSDFARRPWVPNSDWPIDFEDLLPFYRAAAEEHGFADLEAEGQRPGLAPLRAHLADHGLKMSSFWWEQTPTRTRLRFGDEMRASDRLRVVLGATVTELVTDPSGRRVETLRCASLEGRRIAVSAQRVVLATGAIETPRLLLCSDTQAPGGIGNAHDTVGRFYTDHPKFSGGAVRPGPVAARYATDLQYAPKPRFCLCFALDDATQRDRELLEHVVYLKPVYGGRLSRAAAALGLSKPARDGNGVVESYRIKLVTEQTPIRESRVHLLPEKDALGQRRAALDWRFTERDHQSLAEIVRLVADRVHAAGLGEMDFGGAPPTIETMTDAAHQMGTTRMAARPEDGVVDETCRVHGTENLFVAGSAVFPTGPSYSPTFTILALARRLAAHLQEAKTPVTA